MQPSRAGLSPRYSELLKLGGLLGQQSGDQGILPCRMQIARRETTHTSSRRRLRALRYNDGPAMSYRNRKRSS
jgi:hypothetical protein